MQKGTLKLLSDWARRNGMREYCICSLKNVLHALMEGEETRPCQHEKKEHSRTSANIRNLSTLSSVGNEIVVANRLYFKSIEIRLSALGVGESAGILQCIFWWACWWMVILYVIRYVILSVILYVASFVFFFYVTDWTGQGACYVNSRYLCNLRIAENTTDLLQTMHISKLST